MSSRQKKDSNRRNEKKTRQKQNFGSNRHEKQKRFVIAGFFIYNDCDKLI